MHTFLRTDSVELLPATEAAAPVVYQLLRRKQVLRWQDPLSDQADARRLIRRSRNHRKQRTEFLFCIRAVDSGKIVGLIELFKIHRSARCLPSRAPEADLVYVVARPHQGNGYATAAVKLIISFAFDELKLYRVNASTFPDNTASIKVLKKAGFKLEGTRKQSRIRGGRVTSEQIFGSYNSKSGR